MNTNKLLSQMDHQGLFSRKPEMPLGYKQQLALTKRPSMGARLSQHTRLKNIVKYGTHDDCVSTSLSGSRIPLTAALGHSEGTMVKIPEYFRCLVAPLVRQSGVCAVKW